jgi:hypothetical protein
MPGERSCPRRLHCLMLLLLLSWFPLSCGEGWDGYRDIYNQQGELPVPGEPWVGDETVFVALETMEQETPLAGLETWDLLGGGAVRLSDLIEASGITDDPEPYRYDFTAADGYNLLAKREGDTSLLPDWENMQHGFLYPDQGNLRTGWAEHPWGSSVSAYNVKKMNGGRIELLAP